MNRIDQIFSDLRHAKRGGLMPFVTAGDPDLETTVGLLPELEAAGASIVEVGIPFSDPIADGPVIQESMNHALVSGFKVEALFEAVAAARPSLGLGLVAMVSYSIVHRVGLESFVKRAADAGFDGFIFPDLPVEEADDARRVTADHGTILSLLISPTTPIERAKRIAAASSGFVYLLARSGITGERDDLPPELGGRIAELRTATDLPIAVGFGISKPQHVAGVCASADAAIVGSALVRRLAEQRAAGVDAAVAAGADFVRELAGGLPVGA